MSQCGMRQMEEKHVATQVDLMQWCSRLDLLALSNFKGEVQVRRLHHFQTVWNLPPPKETSLVRGMAWRPDGKALSIGYNCGQVLIVDVEDKDILHSFTVEDGADEAGKKVGVTCIAWGMQDGTLGAMGNHNIYDDASLFLPNPPPLSTNYKNKKSEDGISDFKQLHEQNQLNILVVGFGKGKVHLSIFGRFPCGVIDIQQLTNDKCGSITVMDAQLSKDFSIIQVFYTDANNALHLAIVHTAVLSAYSEELFALASKHSHIAHFLSYIDQTMVSITEAWEHILLEMDSKMAAYASNLKEGGVSADLLELLMMGVPSEELEIFLLQELTAKGLKKFGTSVELSYSTIQKLVLKQLNVVGQSLLYFLAELRGLARIPDRYKILGLEEDTVTNAIRASCAFLNKCLELQQVIDLSMRNYKAFFRWLFVVIVRLLEEQTPTEIVKITQQELTYIAEFLYNFDNIQPSKDEGGSSSKKAVRFNLERLAQYLQNEELSILPDDEDNPWHKFLHENKCLVTDSNTVMSMKEFRKYSLVMQRDHLKRAISDVFDFSEKIIGGHYSLLHNLQCHYQQIFGADKNCFRLGQIFQSGQKESYISFAHPPSSQDTLYFMNVVINGNSVKANVSTFYFSSDHINESRLESLERANMIISDVQFYSTEMLSVLLKHPNDEDTSFFVQFPVKTALEQCSEIRIDQIGNSDFFSSLAKVEATSLLDQRIFKVIDKMSGHRIAVSGGRKVAVVLSKSCRKVKVFEMEVDGDEEEDETLDTTPQSQNTTQRSDNSQGTPALNNSSFNNCLKSPDE